MIHEDDASMLTDPAIISKLNLVPLPADRLLRDGDVIQVGKIAVKILHTPGHTGGSFSILADGAVFTGDTLFMGSVGLVKSPEALMKIMNSIKKKLMTLPNRVKVYPGHGLVSTIGKEKTHTPFFYGEGKHASWDTIIEEFY